MKAWLLAFVAIGCSTPAAPDQPASAETPSARTRWVPARSVEALSSFEGPARVIPTPSATAVVSVPVSARVLRVRVQPGERVAEGDPLVDVVMPELIRAAGSLRAAEIRIDALAQRRARLTSLVEQNLARSSEAVELDAALATARADRESARATLRSAGESDARATQLVEGSGVSTLRAPIAGMVVVVSAQPGQVRDPASGPLVEVVGDAARQIEARFVAAPPPDVGFTWIEPGQRVALSLDAVSPRAGNDGTRTAWLHAVDAAQAPVAGALGRVRMSGPATWSAVPIGALRERDGAATVRVEDPSGEVARTVRVVRRSETEAVVDGLAPGTLVAADGEDAP